MAAPARRFIAFSRDWRDIATTAAATALLAAFWWLAVSASIEKSHTSDELPHITAGYAFDRFGDFRMHPENGVLPQRLFGLPSLAEGVRFPMDELLWRRSVTWQLGWEFFYALNNPLDWLILAARSLNALFGVVLGLFIFLVARGWFGRVGGLLALSFFALSPQFLAHAGFATSDLAAATMLTLAPWFFWRHLARRDLTSGLLAGTISGLTLVAKFNGILLAPIYAILVLGDVWLRGTEGSPGAFRARRLATNLMLALGQAAAAVLVIWTFYNLRFTARGPSAPAFEQFAGTWQEMFPSLGWKRIFVEAALRWRLLPEAWIYGLTNVLNGATARNSFMFGEHSIIGWKQFFPLLFLLKTPLSTLGALLLSLTAVTLHLVRARSDVRRTWTVRIAPLLVGTVVVGFTAVSSHLNIGDRHILAIYPMLFVLTGALAARTSLRWLGACFVLAQLGETLTIRPHFLASFNALAGGPSRAYRLFVDSSLDWGQDLPALSEWLAAQRGPEEKVYLGYFGSAWPPHYGVRPTYFLPVTTYIVRPPLEPYALEAGLYCISATALAEVYSMQRGPWTDKDEERYRDLRAKFAAPTSADIANYETYDWLRFARLCKYLQRRKPLAQAGYSILIFRLTRADLQSALEGRVESLHRLQTSPRP